MSQMSMYPSHPKVDTSGKVFWVIRFGTFLHLELSRLDSCFSKNYLFHPCTQNFFCLLFFAWLNSKKIGKKNVFFGEKFCMGSGVLRVERKDEGRQKKRFPENKKADQKRCENC